MHALKSTEKPKTCLFGQPRRLFWLVPGLLVLVLPGLLTACGAGVRPDPHKYQAIRQEVLDAQAQGLSDAAPVEMKFIQQKLAAAELAMQNSDAKQANRLIQEIEVDLETARLRARVNQLNRELEAAKQRNARAEQQLSVLQEALNAQ